MEHGPQTGDNPGSFAILSLACQALFILFFGAFFSYRDASDATTDADAINDVAKVYNLYQDVHVMIFIGFGFLMTFLKKYGFSSVSYNFVVAALTIQWSIIVQGGFIHMMEVGNSHQVEMNTESLIKGDFAAGAILISFGAVLGRITPSQLIMMAMFEVCIYATNEYIGVEILRVVDMGGSIFVHTFGAYFGLGVSLMLGAPDAKKNDQRNASNYNSDMFAMVGTLFLWMFWPSFNGALAPLEYFQRERVVVNTVIALCGSCISAFACSRYFTPGQKFDMVHIQNATLAGGVAVGSSSDLVIEPWGAALIGVCAGFLSVTGYIKISPILERMGLHDTCGVHNLHGLPGIMGGIGGAISAAVATGNSYGTEPEVIFEARSERTAGEQGGYQFLAVVMTLGFSFFGGMIFGFVARSCDGEQEPFHDKSHWELPEEEEPLVAHVEEQPLKESVNPATEDKKEAPAKQEDEVELKIDAN